MGGPSEPKQRRKVHSSCPKHSEEGGHSHRGKAWGLVSKQDEKSAQVRNGSDPVRRVRDHTG